jgi:G:T-mismatch repair DNA endonuclease (very short patch repair protein)
VERDSRNDEALRHLGWNVLAVWECELSSASKVQAIASRIEQLVRSDELVGSGRARARD